MRGTVARVVEPNADAVPRVREPACLSDARGTQSERYDHEYCGYNPGGFPSGSDWHESHVGFLATSSAETCQEEDMQDRCASG
jgi:hypothetical protein